MEARQSMFPFCGEGSILRFLFGGVPHAPKILVVGQSSGSYKKEEKKKQLWVHPTLINRNMNK